MLIAITRILSTYTRITHVHVSLLNLRYVFDKYQALQNPLLKASYQGGRTKSRGYSTQHSILLGVGNGHRVIPKFLLVSFSTKNNNCTS